MSAVLKDPQSVSSLHEAVRLVCERIAPSWPLDQSIAVNPWWNMRSQPISEVAAQLEALGKVHCLMPKAYYKSLWQKQIQPKHLQAACTAFNSKVQEHELVNYLDEQGMPAHHWHNLDDLLDIQPNRKQKMAWRDEIVQQISQYCGLYFQYPQRMHQYSHDIGLYRNWLEIVQHDKGIEVLMAERGLSRQFQKLPQTPEGVFAEMYKLTGQAPQFSEYAYALLLEVHGWASCLAYQAWQDAFTETSNNLVEQLLAIRMAWELALWRHFAANHANVFSDIKQQMLEQFNQYPNIYTKHKQAQAYLWIWQRALEFSFQEPLHKRLLEQAAPTQPLETLQLQAAFCIDVRSEPMRRALEAQAPGIQTLGFAGFFGLPLEYAPTDNGVARPQLPGLLKPAIKATQAERSSKAKAQQHTIARESSSRATGDAAPAAFGLIEALGLAKSFKLLKDSWFPASPQHSINQIDSSGSWQLSREQQTLGAEEQAELASGILQAMGLTCNFAPHVLLLGHGSCSANNPQASALDCGACGGQTGEVNVKVLAQLLNDSAVRHLLKEKNINIPDSTLFIAGLHNTTTDEIKCYEPEETHAAKSADWKTWLQNATKAAQQQRAASLGLCNNSKLGEQYHQRSHDWAELRPEWGLANNAAFIVAPRIRTQHIDLQGRSFLHDYEWQHDHDFTVLELIMTAPMVVTNWINLQYYASVTDNEKYGSGNKMLHNVVGGNLGVFEGNGGDLRIGLAKQSLHDGDHWRHQPLRLNVYIAAPRDAMSSIIDKHTDVAHLINNDWLYLFQLDEDEKNIWQYTKGYWQQLESANTI